MLFGRKTELFIGIFKDESDLNSGFLLDNLDYEFDVTLSTEYMKSCATFTIYNANIQVVNEIMNSGTGVVFKAGYENDQFGTIFVGQIACVYTETEGPEESKIIMICKSQRGAEYPLQRINISAVVRKGKSLYDIAKTLSDYVGLPLSGAEVLSNNILDDDYIICGDIRSEFKKFMSRKLRFIGGSLIVSNNEVIYLDGQNVAHFLTVNLGFKTGLISAKKRRDERYQTSEDAFQENVDYYIGLKNKKKESVVIQHEIDSMMPSKNEIDFECFINPQIHIGQPINIDARLSNDDIFSVRGNFIVKDLHVQGDNFGNQFMMSGVASENVELSAEKLKEINSLEKRLKQLEDEDR